MSERVLQSSQQMTKSWKSIISTPGCFKSYQALSKETLDPLKALRDEQLEKKDPNMRIIASYLQALDSYLKAAL